MSLANKHRPQSFQDVIGQNHITEILKAKIIDDNQSHHNYLFFGPRWTGKTTCARILSKALNCTDLKDGNPCNKCTNCQTINKQTTLDYVEIDAASHTGVDNIREEILDKVPYPPTHLKKKIYVIDEVHMLSKWAFNALLKTIEEPADNVCFILATTEIHKVPDTIISRCQVFNFKKISTDKIIQHIKKISDLENIKYNNEALNLISKISEGCVRDAIKYLDQINILWEITEAHVTKFLGVAPEALIQDFLTKLKNKNRLQIFEQIDELEKQGIDLLQFAKQILMYIDANLKNDIDFLLNTASQFTKILNSIKYYPYPTIMYKMILNENKNNNITQTTKTQTTSSEPKPQNEKDLITQISEQISKNSLKTSIKNHAIIDKIENNLAHIIVINKMSEMLIKKEDAINEIEAIISKILWKPTKISIKYQKKEDYFENLL